MDHDHCQSCVFANCTSRENDCPVQQCPNGCGTALHQCKIAEHVAHTCLEARTPCINAVYGCEETPRRWAQRKHLEHCPASSLMCWFSRTYTRVGVRYLVPRTASPEDPLIEDSSSNVLLDAKLQMGDVKIFSCNEIVRRDELSAHYQSFHVDIQTNMSMVVQRCPMYIYGCNYGEQRLAPNPQGATVDYNKEYDTVLVKPPQVVSDSANESEGAGDYAAKLQKQQELALYGYGDDFEGSLDVLGQLPAEVLTAICHYLDSMSLWQLSQVNHYIRKVCLNTVKKKGIVYHRWVKDEVTKRWLLGPKTWSFSKVFSVIPSWSPTNAPTIGNHLMTCEYYQSMAASYDPGVKWELLGLSEQVELRKPYAKKEPFRHDYDFEVSSGSGESEDISEEEDGWWDDG